MILWLRCERERRRDETVFNFFCASGVFITKGQAVPQCVFPNFKKACFCVCFLFFFLFLFDRVRSLLKYWVARREDLAQRPNILVDFSIRERHNTTSF